MYSSLKPCTFRFSSLSESSAAHKNWTPTCIYKSFHLLFEGRVLKPPSVGAAAIGGTSLLAALSKLEEKPRFWRKHSSCFCTEQLPGCVSCVQDFNASSEQLPPQSLLAKYASGFLCINDTRAFSFTPGICNCSAAYKTIRLSFHLSKCYRWRTVDQHHKMSSIGLSVSKKMDLAYTKARQPLVDVLGKLHAQWSLKKDHNYQMN